jgi:transglutaminase-like putative cysteine protease
MRIRLIPSSTIAAYLIKRWGTLCKFRSSFFQTTLSSSSLQAGSATSDRLLDLEWTHFSHTNPGWARVQANCDFVHERIAFGYEHARVTRSASEAYEEKRGVCRDYAHLAVALAGASILLHQFPKPSR